MFIYLKVVLSKEINIDLVKVIFIIATYLNTRTLRGIIRTHLGLMIDKTETNKINFSLLLYLCS